MRFHLKQVIFEASLSFCVGLKFLLLFLYLLFHRDYFWKWLAMKGPKLLLCFQHADRCHFLLLFLFKVLFVSRIHLYVTYRKISKLESRLYNITVGKCHCFLYPFLRVCSQYQKPFASDHKYTHTRRRIRHPMLNKGFEQPYKKNL